MKDKILKTVNHIYFGVYLYTGEAFYPTFHNGERFYYQGYWGFKLCYVMVLLYACAVVSLGKYCIGESVPCFVNHGIVDIILVLGTCFIIAKITSLGGKKGLLYFEQFTREPHLCKIKWMIISAFVFLLGIILFIIGEIYSPIIVDF